MRSKKLAIALALTLMLSIGLTGCSKATNPSSQAPAKLKVAFIYVGPVGDAGWTYAQDQGRKYLVDHVSGIETTYLENVPEADGEKVADQLVAQGNKVIFATSFGYMDGILASAKKHPDVIFLHCSGVKTADNVGTYFGREYQARYLTGIVAGKTTKSNQIGYVAAFPIPECVRGINAFTLGVRSVNPNAVVKVVWTNTWLDPAKEKDAGLSLAEQGCDVLAQHQDSPAVVQAAEEKGIHALGYDSDMSKYAPNAYLTGPVWNWGPYFVKTVQAVKDGTWKTNAYWGPMSDGVIDIAPFYHVPTDVQTLANEKKQLLLSGKWDVFTGPIKDQQGAVKVKDGASLTDNEMLSLDWFVQGVQGTIPKTQ